MPRLEAEIWLPKPPEAIFPFFADASNLEVLTPPWLNFQVLSPEPIEIDEGTFIRYKLRFRGIPFRWDSEITAWEPPHRFVDEQRRGPYRQWIHEHAFEPQDGGTLARDVVQYAVPGGWLVDRLVVRRDIERIFQYRRRKLAELFGAESSAVA